MISLLVSDGWIVLSFSSNCYEQILIGIRATLGVIKKCSFLEVSKSSWFEETDGQIYDSLRVKHLDEVSDIHWHFFNLSAVELFDFTHHTDIISGDKVDGNTLSAETTTTTDTMNVIFTVRRKIVVDNQ